MEKDRKIILIVKTIENLILGFIKYFIIFIFILAATIDDYVVRPTIIEQIITIGIGLCIAVALDLIINFIIYKVLKRKNIFITYKNLFSVSFIVTLILFIVTFL